MVEMKDLRSQLANVQAFVMPQFISMLLQMTCAYRLFLLDLLCELQSSSNPSCFYDGNGEVGA